VPIGALTVRGISGIWLDVNEPTTFPESGGETTVPDALVADGDGVPTTMAEIHNVYANHQAQATFDGLLAPYRRPFVLSRAGYAGIQRYAAVWTGDAPSAWWTLQQTLPMLLGMSLSGVPFVGSDVGGYSGNATPELYPRWLELGVYSPFFRAHVTRGVRDQEPWSFGQEVLDISRARLAERYALLPYLEVLFAEHAATGAPVLRPFVYELFEERALRTVGDQAMLGPFVMIAPVVEEGATHRAVRFPTGAWLDVESGAVWEGPATATVSVTLAATPVFLREGAIVPRNPGRRRELRLLQLRVHVRRADARDKGWGYELSIGLGMVDRQRGAGSTKMVNFLLAAQTSYEDYVTFGFDFTFNLLDAGHKILDLDQLSLYGVLPFIGAFTELRYDIGSQRVRNVESGVTCDFTKTSSASSPARTITARRI